MFINFAKSQRSKQKIEEDNDSDDEDDDNDFKGQESRDKHYENSKNEFNIKKGDELKEAKVDIPEDKPINNVLLKTVLNSNKNSKRENEFKRNAAARNSSGKANNEQVKGIVNGCSNAAYESAEPSYSVVVKTPDDKGQQTGSSNSDELTNETINNLDTGSINKFEYRSKC